MVEEGEIRMSLPAAHRLLSTTEVAPVGIVAGVSLDPCQQSAIGHSQLRSCCGTTDARYRSDLNVLIAHLLI